MEHNYRSSFSTYPIPGVSAIAILFALLTIIAVLWVHIKKQETTILELQARIVTFECREATNETTER